MSMGGGAGGSGSKGRAWPAMAAWRAGNNPLGVSVNGMNPYQYNRAMAEKSKRGEKDVSTTSKVLKGERGAPGKKSLTGQTLDFAGT